jgi:RNA polymerase sigma-70 factor (ECF subfamily)
MPNDLEKELVERVLNGDSEAFSLLVEPYRRPLLGLAYRITRNTEDAKEVAQETFLRAFKYLRNFDADKSFKNWIYQILVHAARNFRNKQARLEILTMSEPLREMATAAGENPEDRRQEKELRSRLMDCLDVLSPREREVFLLRDIEELNIRESAVVLKCSTVSVRVHLSAARKKIKKRILDKYPSLLERKNEL